MRLTKEQLHKILVGPGHVTKEELEDASKIASESDRHIEDVLIEKDLIKDEQLGQLVAIEFGFKFANLSREGVDRELMRLVPEMVARSRGVIAFARDAGGVRVGMVDPLDDEIIHFLEKRIGEKIIPVVITEKDLHNALALYEDSIGDIFKNILKQLDDQLLPRDKRDELTVTAVDTLLQYGNQNKASDVHIEPFRSKILVRFRIDGVLHDVLEIPKKMADSILTRIKILSGMRTDEHRAAQDGKMQFTADGEQVDVRVSIVPVTLGENIVMRLLSAKNRRFNLTDLGLEDKDLERVNHNIGHPHGMILVTGPTGSGKTTTIYAILKILNTREVHISTIEDPVEYDIEGISQIQVNVRTNLTFAKGLRAIVRQDPDIIMVGEIRDQETAGIAVNSAMTGHLVLSTLHANDAATTLPRLLDMGIEPFLVSSTVNVIIAQRLVRKICDKCRASYALSEREKNLIAHDERLKGALEKHGMKDLKKARFYAGSGCDACSKTGYAGRVGIFEVLEMSDEIRSLVASRSSSGDIIKKAVEGGMTTMLEDGMGKVLRGVVTLGEVLQATME
jgi:type IV pilus assembly protein PilB